MHRRRPESSRCLPIALLADRPLPGLPQEVAAGSAPLIELRHASKSYVSADGGSPVIVLDDINLEVREGEMLALLGQSGSGKSTILRLMAGLTEPTQGAVLSHGAPLSGVNHRLAIVFQSFALYPWLTVQENVQVGSHPAPPRRGSRKRRRSDRALELIGLVRLRECVSEAVVGRHAPARRSSRARSSRSRKCLCMDEPFSALDVLTAENLRTQVVDLWRGSQHAGLKSIFLVTHNIAEAVFMATRIVIISSHPGSHSHCHCQSAALSAEREFQAVCGAGRPGARGDHGVGPAR